MNARWQVGLIVEIGLGLAVILIVGHMAVRDLADPPGGQRVPVLARLLRRDARIQLTISSASR